MISSMLFYLMPTQLPFLLRIGGFTSAAVAGLVLGLLAALQTIASLLSARLQSTIPASTLVALGFVGLAGGLLIISRATEIEHFATGAVIIGLALGLMTPAMMVLLLDSAPHALRGRATGWMTASIFLGQFLSSVISQPLAWRLGLPATFLLAGTAAIVLGAACYAVRPLRSGTNTTESDHFNKPPDQTE